MFLTNLFNFKKECSHSKIANNVDSAYCPDCGKLIKNEWYITRCDCCGIKLHTTSRNGKIFPLNNYCTNCGSKLVDGAKFCSECGARVVRPEGNASSHSPEQP